MLVPQKTKLLTTNVAKCLVAGSSGIRRDKPKSKHLGNGCNLVLHNIHLSKASGPCAELRTQNLTNITFGKAEPSNNVIVANPPVATVDAEICG